MSHLLDVNLLLACVWSSHKEHTRANRWLSTLPQFSSCSITQMGFLRVSLSAAFNASFADARAALQALLDLPEHRFLSDGTTAATLPAVASAKEVTDAHLVRLAASHRLKLATLDVDLCRKSWAATIAEHPI